MSAGRLPDFIGIGPPRTGTSWLHKVLDGYVGLPDGFKEIHYFQWWYGKGLDWYRWHFRKCPPGLPIGEFCPSYFASDRARDRIAKDLPQTRIICTLREPVARLYSHYKLMRSAGMARGSFEECVARRDVLIESSRYAHYLEKWFASFGRERVLVLFQDDLETAPQAYLRSVCSFVGIPEFELDPAASRERVWHHESPPRFHRLARSAALTRGWLRSHRLYPIVNLWEKTALWDFCFSGGPPFPRLDPALVVRLRVQLRPEVDALEALIGRDLSSWKDLPAGEHRRAPATSAA